MIVNIIDTLLNSGHLFIKMSTTKSYYQSVCCSYISDEQQAHEIEGETEQRQEQRLVLQIGSELRKLIHYSCTDPLHVTKLQEREREKTSQ